MCLYIPLGAFWSDYFKCVLPLKRLRVEGRDGLGERVGTLVFHLLPFSIIWIHFPQAHTFVLKSEYNDNKTIKKQNFGPLKPVLWLGQDVVAAGRWSLSWRRGGSCQRVPSPDCRPRLEAIRGSEMLGVKCPGRCKEAPSLSLVLCVCSLLSS